MDLWVERALVEVAAARHQEDLVLRDSLPFYLDHLANALSTTTERTVARQLAEKELSIKIGQKHGKDRARSYNYSMGQVIYEYHIMRQVICDVLETEAPLTPIEREVIVCSIERGVNVAATEYSKTLKEIQNQLTQTLAHDFRTPLMIAKVNLQLLLRRPDDMDNTINKASKASVSLDRLDRMIQDLLDASRMKTGTELKLEMSNDCDLNWIIREVAGDLRDSRENEIIIKSPGICNGTWNENGLRRAIENLVTNAIKYGKPNRPVTIELTQNRDSASVSVHNEGEPIPKEELPILFQQYRRSRKVEDKIGWGLGLSVVKGMADAHMGQVSVSSDKDSGTTFVMTIPKNPQRQTEPKTL